MNYSRSPQCEGGCPHLAQLHEKSWAFRRRILDLAYRVGKVHLGSSFSGAELMTVLYYHEVTKDPEGFKDYVVTCARSVLTYTILADMGFYAEEDLETLGQWGTKLDYERVPDLVQLPFGPLGHSLSYANGVAYGLRKRGLPERVYCVLGDGELNEGSVWEAALTAGHLGLDNVIAVVDRNEFQLSGSTEDIKRLEPLDRKFESFGWRCLNADGHSVASVVDAFGRARAEREKPTVIVARTRKGFGVSFMENSPRYHSTAIGVAEYEAAQAELRRRGQWPAGAE